MTETKDSRQDADSAADTRGLRLLCLLPSIPLGGMERAASRVVEKLMLRGADAHFVAEKHWGIEVQRHIESIGGQWTGIPFIAKLGFPQTLLEWRWALRSFARSATDLKNVFDSYQPRQLLATNINNAYFARHLARRKNVRSIFRLPNPPGESKSAIKRTLDKVIWRSVYRSFDVLVCNSAYTARQAADVIGDNDRIIVIRNYLPTLSRPHSGSSLQLPKDRITIAYIGQISRQKGVEILIDAMQEIIEKRDDVDLVLAGPDIWQDSFGPQIRQRIDNAGLRQRIRFLGHVDDVHALLKQADIHVCPSISAGDSFPNVVLDAKQAGLPSVVFPTAGLPEAVSDGVDGIVTELCSADALRSELNRLLSDNALCKRLSDGAIKSLSAYQDEKIAADWVRAFTD